MSRVGQTTGSSAPSPGHLWPLLTFVQIADHGLLLQEIITQLLVEPERQHVVSERAGEKDTRELAPFFLPGEGAPGEGGLPGTVRSGNEGRPPWPTTGHGDRRCVCGELEAMRTGLPAGENPRLALVPNVPPGRDPQGGVVVVPSPQLPEGDVLIEPQTVVAFLLRHVAPLLPASTGDRRPFQNAVASPTSRPPALIYRGHPSVASLTRSGEHLP